MDHRTRELTEIAAALRRSRRILAFCHVNPDGDALGALLALGWFLADAETEVCLVCSDPVPDKLRFLPGAERILTTPPAGPWDVIVSLDSSDRVRLGPAFHAVENSGAPLVVIDHHITNPGFGDLNYVKPAAASTSEILVDLADVLGIPLAREAAVCLLTGILTDTLSFRTSNVTPHVLRVASRLMEAGADLHRLADLSLGRRPVSVMRLWGLALSQLQLRDGVLWTEVTREMRAAAGVPDEDDGGLVSYLINANEANIAVVFGEMDNGSIDLDLRARQPYEVASVALSLGGGGHPQASGCLLPGPLADAEARVMPLLLGLSTR